MRTFFRGLSSQRGTTFRELHVQQLSTRFGGLRVFEEVSFNLAPGEILGVIGPNGAGKTTLINVISGRLKPTMGSIVFGGRDVTGQPMHTLSRLGVVRSFQQTNTFRTATVRENISRAIRFSRKPLTWASINSLLSEFDLASRLEDQSDKLPYGLQKMLGLMMAYVTAPEVLLLDEPAAGLDRNERMRVDEVVRRAQADLSCSILIVEHDMDLVRRLCPRIIVLDAGHVLAEGPPEKVLARPEVIKAYLGETEGDE